jgi:hypothetical protein
MPDTVVSSLIASVTAAGEMPTIDAAALFLPASATAIKYRI